MRKISSFFLTVFAILIIVVCMAISLDLTGIVKLPENLSLKKYLSKSIGTLGAGEEIYYPDYEATGLKAENKVAQDTKEAVATTTVKEVQGQSIETTEIDQEALNKILDGMNYTEVVTPDYNVTDNSFFYTQLDTYGKTFYSRLYSNLDNLKTGTYTVDFGVTFNELLQTSSGETIITNALI